MNKLNFDHARSAAIRELLMDQAASVTPPTRARRHQARAVERQRLIVTGVVAAVVVLVAGVAIRVGSDSSEHTHPARTGTDSRALETSTDLRTILPKATGTVLHTWTSEDSTLTTGPFQAAGRSLQWTAACEGGGAISITIPKRAPFKLSCTTRKGVGPNGPSDLHALGKPEVETGLVRVYVAVISGSPTFRVQLTAADPRILLAQQGQWSVGKTSANVPRSLRTCSAADLSTTGIFTRLPDSHEGVNTITNTAATDCAVREWPTVRFLDAGGKAVGDPAGHQVGSTHDLNKYGEFPPARLAAGQDGYLIAQLFTLEKLQADDLQTSRTPTTPPNTLAPAPPICEPRQVQSLLVGIGAASVTVPAPTNPPAAACQNKGFSFGVEPVVTARPTTAD